MTFPEALGLALGGVGLFAIFLGMMWWTMDSWSDGEWWERGLNFTAWVLIIAVVVYFTDWPGAPA